MATPKNFTEAAWQHALRVINTPYIWQGKGDICWKPEAPNFYRHNWGQPVFDCSGLVAWALWQAGGPDWRLTMNADTFKKTLPTPLDLVEQFHLRFYGHLDGVAHHIAFAWGEPSIHAPAIVLEAAGGDQNTLEPVPSARVMQRAQARGDCIATRLLIAEPRG